MRMVGKIDSPQVKVIRTNNSEGVSSTQKVIVAKVTFEYSDDAILGLAENAGEPMNIEVKASQMSLEDSGLGAPKRGRPRKAADPSQAELDEVDRDAKKGRKRANGKSRRVDATHIV